MQPRHSNRPATLLIVDDSPTTLRVMEAVLVEHGYEVVCLEGGREALETAKRVEPDLLFIDFAMPDVNGFAVCKALGSDPEVSSIPIVLMCTRGDPIGERFVREMGIVDHITKPFPPEALLAITEHTLERTRAAQCRPAPPRAREFGESSPSPNVTNAQLAEALSKALAKQAVTVSAEALSKALAECDPAGLANAARSAALVGDLAIVQIAEVLQLLSLQRQTGFLVVRRDEMEVSIAVKDGAVRLVTGSNTPPELLLGNILVQERLMGAAELEQLLSNRRGTKRLIGRQFVQLGYLTQDELHRALRRQSSELVYGLLRWGRGSFIFTRKEALPSEVLEFEFNLSIDELLMEGFRRVDEWGLIEGVIPTFDVAPYAIPGGLERLGCEALTAEDHRILRAVAAGHTVNEIIRKVGGSTFEVARGVCRLVAARVIAIPPPLPRENKEKASTAVTLTD